MGSGASKTAPEPNPHLRPVTPRRISVAPADEVPQDDTKQQQKSGREKIKQKQSKRKKDVKKLNKLEDNHKENNPTSVSSISHLNKPTRMNDIDTPTTFEPVAPSQPVVSTGETRELIELKDKVASSDVMMQQMMQQIEALVKQVAAANSKSYESSPQGNGTNSQPVPQPAISRSQSTSESATCQPKDNLSDLDTSVADIMTIPTPSPTPANVKSVRLSDSFNYGMSDVETDDGMSQPPSAHQSPYASLQSTSTSVGGLFGNKNTHDATALNTSVTLNIPEGVPEYIPMTRPKSARQQGRPQAGKNVDLSVYERFARHLFSLADADKDNLLSELELRWALSSKLLTTNLNDDQAVRMIMRNAPRGLLKYHDFSPAFLKMLKQKFASNKSSDEWVHVGYSDDSANGKPMYLHVATGEMVEMARVAASDASNDTLQFIMMVDEATGTVLTTYVDENGIRHYADGDRWIQVPKSMPLVPFDEFDGTTIGTTTNHLRSNTPAYDDEIEYFSVQDPATGDIHQGVQANEYVFSKKILNSRVGKWLPLPSSWEAHTPDVTKMLREIDEALPEWGSVSEQILALRMCHYVVQDAIAWKFTDVQCNGGKWNTQSVSDTMKLKSLEDQIKDKDDTITELKRATKIAEAKASELRKSVQEEERHTEDAKALAERQTRRIKMLEDELQIQFEDSQKATTRQRARISSLESELDIALKQSDSAIARNQQHVSNIEEKMATLKKSHEHAEQQHYKQRDELQAELYEAKRENLENRQAKEEAASLRAQLEELKMQAIVAEANESTAANSLQHEVAILKSQLRDAEKYKEQALEAKAEVEQKSLLISKLQDSSNDYRQKLKFELDDAKREVETLKNSVEGAANINADEVESLKHALAKERENGMKASNDLVLLKRNTAKTMGQLQFAVSNLRASKDELRRDSHDIINHLFKLFKELYPGVNQLIKIVLNFEVDKKAMLDKYRQEVVARKLLYNQLQELRGNIRVFCRVRKDDCKIAVKCVSDSEILIPVGDRGRTKCYEFDRVYDPTATQEQVYSDASSIVQSVVDGYNVCYLAYGQTGSGKTFTMMGPPDNPDLAGVNRRAVHDLFQHCKGRKDVDYELNVNMVEIYNDNIYDLLAGHHVEPLRLKQQPDGSTEIEDLIIRKVNSPEDVTAVLAEADENRSIASTAMNMHSSRSHLILQITVVGFNRISEVTTVGKLSLVDLAGSERVNKSEAKGARLVEAVNINKSLTSLGMVFSALGQKQKHIPYRNCKLTHLLQDSLGGDAKACMFLNLSPKDSNLNETRSTLNFGIGIAKIELGPK